MERKIVDYCYVIVVDEDCIRRKIKEGWQPYGSPIIAANDAAWQGNLVQAMVKYEDVTLDNNPSVRDLITKTIGAFSGEGLSFKEYGALSKRWQEILENIK